MGRVLCGLAGFRKKSEETARIRRRFDLGEADVPGNNSEDIVQVVRDSAGKCPKRFQLAGGEPFRFRFLALADIAKKNGDAAVARVGVDVVPNLPGRIHGFEFDGDLLGHDALVVRLENGTDKRGKFFPQEAAEKCVPLRALTIVDSCQSLVNARTTPVDAPGT